MTDSKSIVIKKTPLSGQRQAEPQGGQGQPTGQPPVWGGAAPSAPQAPAQPAQWPNQPQQPTQQQAPAQPQWPNQVQQPGQQQWPNQAQQPGQPQWPNQTQQPAQPQWPNQVQQPGQPQWPNQPQQPGQPYWHTNGQGTWAPTAPTPGLFEQPVGGGLFEEPAAPSNAGSDKTMELLSEIKQYMDTQRQQDTIEQQRKAVRQRIEATGVTDPATIDAIISEIIPTTVAQPPQVSDNNAQGQGTENKPKTNTMRAALNIVDAVDSNLSAVAKSPQFADYAHKTIISYNAVGKPVTLAQAIAAQSSSEVGDAAAFILQAARNFVGGQPQQAYQPAVPTVGGATGNTAYPSYNQQPQPPATLAEKIDGILNRNK